MGWKAVWKGLEVTSWPGRVGRKKVDGKGVTY